MTKLPCKETRVLLWISKTVKSANTILLAHLMILMCERCLSFFSFEWCERCLICSIMSVYWSYLIGERGSGGWWCFCLSKGVFIMRVLHLRGFVGFFCCLYCLFLVGFGATKSTHLKELWRTFLLSFLDVYASSAINLRFIFIIFMILFGLCLSCSGHGIQNFHSWNPLKLCC